MHTMRLALLLGLSALAACGGDKQATTATATEDGLPKPAAAGQSVTGMPDPGVPNAQRAPIPAQAPEIVGIPEETLAEAVEPAEPVLLPAPEIATADPAQAPGELPLAPAPLPEADAAPAVEPQP